MYQSVLYTKLNFNPLPRKEGDNDTRDKMTYRIHFNPLPRKEGDYRYWFLEELGIQNFNPLPRKEGDARRVHYAKKAIAISIHSLVKRET